MEILTLFDCLLSIITEQFKMNKLSIGTLLFLMSCVIVSAKVRSVKREASLNEPPDERYWKRAAGGNKKNDDDEDFDIDNIVKKVNGDTKKKFKARL